jgi:hypothetical protein
MPPHAVSLIYDRHLQSFVCPNSWAIGLNCALLSAMAILPQSALLDRLGRGFTSCKSTRVLSPKKFFG